MREESSASGGPPRFTVLLGGARSGKSRHAVELARPASSVLFIATATPSDEEMEARIERHRSERPSHWRTLEVGGGLVRAIPRHVGPEDTVLLDCLSLWVGHLLLRHRGEDGSRSEETVLGETRKLVGAITGHGRRWYVVSNEVGTGLHPNTALGRRFRDILGLVNQEVAAAADRVLYLVAGLPQRIK